MATCVHISNISVGGPKNKDDPTAITLFAPHSAMLHVYQGLDCTKVPFESEKNVWSGKVKSRSRRGQDKVERQFQCKINLKLRQSNHNHNHNYDLMGFDTIEINLVMLY